MMLQIRKTKSEMYERYLLLSIGNFDHLLCVSLLSRDALFKLKKGAVGYHVNE
jgi:hypothetical protein